MTTNDHSLADWTTDQLIDALANAKALGDPRHALTPGTQRLAWIVTPILQTEIQRRKDTDQ